MDNRQAAEADAPRPFIRSRVKEDRSISDTC